MQDERSGWLRAGVLPVPSDLRAMIERASDIAVGIGPDGRVTGISVNPDNPSLGCLDHWVGSPFENFLALESQIKFRERLGEIETVPDAARRPVELNHMDNVAWEFPVKYTIHQVEDGSILLIGRDMEPIAEVQKRLVTEQLARERDQQRLRSEQTFYRVALEASETPLIMIDPAQGRVRDINSAAAELLGVKPDGLAGNVAAQAFEGRRREEFIDALGSAATAEDRGSVEVVARRNGRLLLLYPEYFRAAGELFLLCRAEAAEEDEQGDSQSSQALSSLFAASSDAIVVIDPAGLIQDANESFLILADAAQLRDVRDRALADFLDRGSVDVKLILDSVARTGQLRNYTARLKSVVGTRIEVDISAARLRYGGTEQGCGLILRVAAADAQSADPSAVMSDDAMKSVMELVGTASLKELVSATADVIEKMCIETAINLTGNNRVAAAEMLGLSRQSLYVKLRKHGMIRSGTGEGGEE